MKNLKIYIIGLVGIGLFFFYYLPNLLVENKNLTYESGTLRKVYIEKYIRKRRTMFRSVEKERLVLVTIDREQREYKLNSDFKKYWKIFQDTNAINKYLKVRLDINKSRHNPVEIKLDNKLIYEKSDWAKSNWIFIALLIGILMIIANLIYEKNYPQQQL